MAAYICFIQLEFSLLHDAERQDKGIPHYLQPLNTFIFQLRLQSVQNTAPRIVTRARKFVLTIPILKNLHWLPVRHRIGYKIIFYWSTMLSMEQCLATSVTYLIIKPVKPGFHIIVRIVPIVPVVSKKIFRRPGRSYGNATQTIANYPDD